MSTLVERFWDKVSPEPNSGCWFWIGAYNKDGYGSIFIGPKRGRTRLATHVSLEIDERSRPSKKHHALHTCDNPSCVNPSHLWWGTHSENMSDALKKGRLDYSGFQKSWQRTREERRHTHCKRGHALDGNNLYISPKGRRQCAVCMRLRERAYRQGDMFRDAPQPKPEQMEFET